MPPRIRLSVCLSLTIMLKLKAGLGWNLLCTLTLSTGRISLFSRPCDLSCCTGPIFKFQMNVAPDSRSLKERNKPSYFGHPMTFNLAFLPLCQPEDPTRLL